MNKTLFLFLLSFFTSCSTAYLNHYQNNSYMKLTASYDTEKNGIDLSWSYSEDSVKINIFRGDSGQNLQDLKTFSGQNGWLDSSIPAGKEYFYQAKAFNPQGRVVASSDVVRGLRAYQGDSAPVPSDFHIEPGSALSKIALAWIGAPGQSYRLYRSLSANAGYHPIADVTDHFYQDSGLAPNTGYYYKLSVIYKNISGSVQEKFYGSGSGDITGGAYLRGQTLSDTL